jgi:hypothetical protein
MIKTGGVPLKLTVSTAADKPLETRQDRLLYLLLLLFICFFEIRVIQLIQVWGLPREIYGAQGILLGVPEWRVYQNRLLGPSIVLSIAFVTKHSFSESYITGLSALVSLPILLTFGLVRRIKSRALAGLTAAAQFAVAVVVLQDRSFFYLWDAIDLSTMLLFAYAVFCTKTDLRVLIPLFFVELLNRESAGFIAFWITVSSLGMLIFDRSSTINRTALIAKSALGIALFGVGTWWTHFIRALLFKHSYVRQLGTDQMNASNGEHYTFFFNLNNFGHCTDIQSFSIALICLLALGLMLVRCVTSQPKALAYPVVLLITAMVTSVWLFGLVDETRVWLEFIPFGLIFIYTGGLKTNASLTEPKTGATLDNNPKPDADLRRAL